MRFPLLPLLSLFSLTTSLASKLHLHQVLIIHRHGDRTPITPLKDEHFWSSTLPEEHVLHGIGRGTELVREEGYVKNSHGAVGRGPFGQLTMMGLLQMVQLGERLREELDHTTTHDNTNSDDRFINNGKLFTQEKPLHPRRISVMSTDFPRTIQSVQALLTGLFPDISPEIHGPIQIDVRDTNSYLIPDPQPRQSPQQLVLEAQLSNRRHLREREEELKDLSHRISKELKQYLGEGASGVSFGIGEEKDDVAAVEKPLSWAQMSEILTCLHSRSKLPPTLSEEDVNAVSNHVAWRWFENLKHPILAKTSMWKFANNLLESMDRKIEVDCQCCDCAEDGNEVECVDEPWLRIYSAHDSTLIGLLCLLQLERPAEWPEYGSYLKMELIREVNDDNDADEEEKKSQYWVRFSLNGQVLRSTWCFDDNGEPMAMVPLRDLEDMIHLEHELLDGDGAESLKFSWKQGLLTKH